MGEKGMKAFFKREFTGSKLLFHVLFWGVHWGVFALGWYVLPRRSSWMNRH